MNRESLFAGILIGLGAVGYLALGGLPGAVIFSFGLMSVIYFGVPLYTGQAGVTKDLWFLTKVWFFNVLVVLQRAGLRVAGPAGPLPGR